MRKNDFYWLDTRTDDDKCVIESDKYFSPSVCAMFCFISFSLFLSIGGEFFF